MACLVKELGIGRVITANGAERVSVMRFFLTPSPCDFPILLPLFHVTRRRMNCVVRGRRRMGVDDKVRVTKRPHKGQAKLLIKKVALRVAS